MWLAMWLATTYITLWSINEITHLVAGQAVTNNSRRLRDLLEDDGVIDEGIYLCSKYTRGEGSDIGVRGCYWSEGEAFKHALVKGREQMQEGHSRN